jgi:hypothetical protein
MGAKRLREISAIGISAFLVLALSACTVNVGVPNDSGVSPSNSNEASEEPSSSSSASQDYLSQLNSVADQESDILLRYDSVSGENYTDDLTMFNTLIELLPDIQSFISEIEAISPTDAKLAAIHKDYVDGWNLQSKGMTLAAAALQEQDIGKMAEANDALAQGRSLLSSVAKEIALLN